MSAHKRNYRLNRDETLAVRLLGSARAAVRAETLEKLARNVFLELSALLQPHPMFIYIADARVPSPHYHELGFEKAVSRDILQICVRESDRISRSPSLQSEMIVRPDRDGSLHLILYPMQNEERWFGFIGAVAQTAPHRLFADPWKVHWELFLSLLADSIHRLIKQAESAKQLSRYNAYLTVSSMLAHSANLNELFETALYCCMEELSAEAASVILHQPDSNHLYFYQVEGPARESLKARRFPAGEGIAGAVLQTRQSEIVNDAQNDSRFLGEMDELSGFRTRNMIAAPLLTGGQQVGVIEVLNKKNGRPFHEEERLLVLLVAEEIAYAVRNARIFELAVNGYCRQRQGHRSCRGCERPLGSWTPCVKYHTHNDPTSLLSSTSAPIF